MAEVDLDALRRLVQQSSSTEPVRLSWLRFSEVVSALERIPELERERARHHALLEEADRLVWRYSLGTEESTEARPPVVRQFRRRVRAALADAPPPSLKETAESIVKNYGEAIRKVDAPTEEGSGG